MIRSEWNDRVGIPVGTSLNLPSFPQVRLDMFAVESRRSGPSGGSLIPRKFSNPDDTINAEGLKSSVAAMLAWYRGRNLQQVTAAAEWFVEIDVKHTVEEFIRGLDSDDPFQVDEAKELLAAFSELAFKQVLGLIGDPVHRGNAVEILARMDGNVVPHLLRHLDRRKSTNCRTGILGALTGHLDHPEAVKAVADGLRDSDPIVQATVCQSLLESGPRGHRILEQVFPTEKVVAA